MTSKFNKIEIGNYVYANAQFGGQLGNIVITNALNTNSLQLTIDSLFNPAIYSIDTSSFSYSNLSLYGNNILLNPASAGAAQNIGIWTETPQYALDVNGPIGNSAGDLNLIATSDAFNLSGVDGIISLFAGSIFASVETHGVPLGINGSTTGGFVGIGTNFPGARLDVNGTITNTNGDVSIMAGNGYNVVIGQNFNDTSTLTFDSVSENITFYSAVGAVIVNCPFNTNGDINVGGAVNMNGSISCGTSSLAFYVGGGQRRMVLTPSGLGINNVSPNKWLDVSGDIRVTSGNIGVSGSIATSLRMVSGTFTMNSGDSVMLVNTTISGSTGTMPTSSGLIGTQFTIKDWKGTAASKNIVITGFSGQTFDGASNLIISSNYGSYTLVSDNSNWSVI